MRLRVLRLSGIAAAMALSAASPWAQSSGSREAHDRAAQAALQEESAAAIASALATLHEPRPDAQLHLRATADVSHGATDVWVAGELTRPSPPDGWAAGARAEIEISGETATGAAHVTLAPGERAFVSKVRLSGTAGGTLDICVHLTPAAGDAAPVSERVRLDASEGASPLLYRASPSTRNRAIPAADPRFSRKERVRLELRLPAGFHAGSGRIVDASGRAVTPVKVTGSSDRSTGEAWMLADLTLAALEPADYVVELLARSGSTTRRVLTAIRVVR